MSTKVVMPQLGESVVEGTVGKWFKQVGDTIEQYEPIMEVVTDKVTTEVPSPASGTLTEIIIPEGTTVKAGTVLAVIGGELKSPTPRPTDTAATPAPLPNPRPSGQFETPTPELKSPSDPPPGVPASSSSESDTGAARRLTPVVSSMIAKNNITAAEFSTIAGTGGGGRVTKKDMEDYLSTRRAPSPAAPPVTPSKPAAGLKDEVLPVTAMRKAIADHMVRSKTISPHVASVHEVDLTQVIAYQKRHAEEFARQGVKLTYTAFFVQAAVAALKAWPVVNASYTDQGILMHKHINVGVAVALEDGLIVPVLKDADEKSLLGAARGVNDLAERARGKKLTPEDVAGGTFTITNFGVFGALFGMPIINQPQSAILGVGAVQKRAVVISVPTPGGGTSDSIAIRPMCYFSMTIDHRLLDGAIGDQFMNVFRKYLEEYQL